jgi:hypothetical protein
MKLQLPDMHMQSIFVESRFKGLDMKHPIRVLGFMVVGMSLCLFHLSAQNGEACIVFLFVTRTNTFVWTKCGQ